MTKIPKIYLIGSGPGDTGLLTIKAQEIIKKCDAIIYDNLINPDILDLVPDNAEKIYVGKKANQHTLKQEEINDLLVCKAREYKCIVRLKGGDPIIFGRGAEEAEFIRDHNIEFEIIPGISSAVAAPIYAGIPLTHRNFCSAFMVLTGHEDPLKEESSINWKNVAEFNGTVVILMGVKNLSNITEKLISLGRNDFEPSAIIYWGTTPDQTVLTARLSDIANVAKENNIKPPCVFITGDVVNLRDKLNWFEKLPLFNKKVVITRPKEQNSYFKSSLKALGANVIEIPSIKIDSVDDFTLIDNEFNNIKSYDWLIFTSVNGVKHFFNRLYFLNFDSRHLSNIKIATIGNVTKTELLKHGIISDFTPDRFLSDEIVKGLNAINEISGKKILLARSDISRIEFSEALINKGAIVEDLIVYKTLLNQNDGDFIKNTLSINKIDIITFTSPSTVNNFIKLVPENYIFNELKETYIASIGPVTSNKIKESILKRVDIEATTHNIDGLLEAIIKFIN
ncbi:MAG: uroporphyrinogen-III C-methyltransferase [Cyanobacteriota bacterium]